MIEDIVEKLYQEAARIEESADHSKRRHYNAADFWSRRHYWLGIPATICATTAGISAFRENSILVIIASIAAAILTSLMTFLNTEKRCEQHRIYGSKYDALMTSARQFREIEFIGDEDTKAMKSRLAEVTATQTKLNSEAPSTPRCSYAQAKEDIDKGASEFRTDAES
jgi:hypothetical protein